MKFINKIVRIYICLGFFFSNLKELSKSDLNTLTHKYFDDLVTERVNDKFGDLVKKMTDLVDENTEIYKKIKFETYKRKRPDVTLRNMNNPVSEETKQKMKDAWKKRKRVKRGWQALISPEEEIRPKEKTEYL
jgi:nitrous oxide reductase